MWVLPHFVKDTIANALNCCMCAEDRVAPGNRHRLLKQSSTLQTAVVISRACQLFAEVTRDRRSDCRVRLHDTALYAACINDPLAFRR